MQFAIKQHESNFDFAKKQEKLVKMLKKEGAVSENLDF